MGKKERLENFIERIFESSHLKIEAGAIQKAFQEEIFLNAEEVHKYIKNMQEVWNNWKLSAETTVVSKFIEEMGGYIFIIWLSDVYPFNLKKIEANCPSGVSAVDSRLHVAYTFDKNELKIIRSLLDKHSIEAQEDVVARTLIVEAIKSISGTFSKIIQQSYKIFTSDVILVPGKGTVRVQYAGAGRVVK